MTKICLSILLSFLISCTELIGQNDSYFSKTQDTVSAYGPNCITRNILQDKNGLYWLATWQGIISYDGNVFTNYTLKEGLINFHVFNIFEDKKGNLWFCTVRGGVYRYDGKSFKLFTTKDGLADNSVNCMLEDNSGNLWFGTWAGASRYDGTTFTNFRKQDGLSDSWIISILQDKTGKLWFGVHDRFSSIPGSGVICYDGKAFTNFLNKEGLPFKMDITQIAEDKAGNIWIGSFNGLCRYDGKVFNEILTENVYYIKEDKSGDLWLSVHEADPSGQALYRYNGKSFTKIIGKYDPDDKQIFGISEDKAGNIWFGTMKGPCKYNGKSVASFLK